MTSPPSECVMKLGNTEVAGTLIAISADDGMCMMTAPANEELDLSQLGTRFLSPGAKAAISEAWRSRSADSQTAESWKEAVKHADVDLTEGESADLFRACSNGNFGDLPELPAWAAELVNDADESPVPPTWVFVSDACVAFLSQAPAYEDADDSEEDLADCALSQYTFVSKNITPSDISIGMPVTLTITVHDHATVALIHGFQDGSCIVIESGAFPDDHYKIAAEDAGDARPGQIDGVAVAYSCCTASYAAVLIRNVRGEFWIPVALCRTSQGPQEPSDANGSEGNAPTFGQIKGDFYVNKDGKRMHIATALKILQRWVDQVSTNRSERFRVRNKKDESDLVPLAFYAVKLNVASTIPVFAIASLDKLVRVAEGSATSYLDTASYSTPNVDTQFTFYDLLEDGNYVRSVRQTNQEPHTAANSRVISRVDLQMSGVLGVNGGTLSGASKAAMLEKSFVDERQAAAVDVVSLQVPKKARTGTATKAPPLTGLCALSANLGEARAGDVLLTVNGRRVDGATAGRSALRSAINREQANGGHVELTFWRPPVGWTPPVAAREDDEGTEQADSDSAPAQLARGELQEVEMTNLARVTKRLEGGDSNSNLTRFCTTLGVPSSGSVLNKKRRLETELRRLNFSNNSDWAPTHSDITSLFAGGTDAFHAKFGAVVHTVATADRMLRGLSLSLSA